DQPLEDILGFPGVLMRARWMHAAFAWHVFPALDPLNLMPPRLLQGLHERATFHVAGYGQAKERQHRRRDIKQACAVDPLVLANPWAAHRHDAERSVPGRGSWPPKAARTARPEMTRVEPVVGNKNDSRV